MCRSKEGQGSNEDEKKVEDRGPREGRGLHVPPRLSRHRYSFRKMYFTGVISINSTLSGIRPRSRDSLSSMFQTQAQAGMRKNGVKGSEVNKEE